MSLLKNSALAFFSVVVFLLVAEGVLALLGVKPALFESDPLVGFASHIPLYVPEDVPEAADRDDAKGSAGWMHRADNKRAFFNAQRFLAEKPDGTTRVFCVGGSTTYGRPYGDPTSFCGWLRELLPIADPSRSWELINAGGISYASYRVAALMEELVEYQPDWFVIYSGHNEFLEARTYGELKESPALLLELRALLNRTRTYTTLKKVIDGVRGTSDGEIMKENVLPGEVEALLDDSVGLNAYQRDDAMRTGVMAHFRLNLNRMIDIAESVGAHPMLVVPASNQASCSPFKSVLSAELSDQERLSFREWMKKARWRQSRRRFDRALAAVDEAIAIDSRYAAAHFLRGQILQAMSRFDEARRSFRTAIDEDVCPLRALSETADTVAEVAAERDVPLVDWARYLEQQAANGMVGDQFFLDHVHMTIAANRMLAIQIIESLHDRGVFEYGPNWGVPEIARIAAEVEGRLDSRAHAHALTNLAKVFGWAGKNEEASELAKRALEVVDDAESYNNAAMNAIRLGKLEEALEYFEQVLKREPRHASALSDMGFVLSRLGRDEQAAAALRKSIAIADSERARYNMGRLLEKQQRYDEAIAEFREAIRINPERADYHVAIAGIHEKREQHQRALQELSQALSKDTGSARAYYLRAVVDQKLGDSEGAVGDLRSMLALAPDSPRAHTQLAWLLCCDPDPALRDGAAAVESANYAVRLTRSKDPDSLGALAAAYAETGQWTEAVDTARAALKAVAASAPGDETAAARERIASFERKQPYRLSRGPAVPGP